MAGGAQGGLPWPAAGRALSARFYTDPALYARELATMFGDGWFCVAPVSAVPEPGDYHSFTVGAEPLMLVRGTDRAVRVMTRVCSHRSMLVVEGDGRTARFTCPYHAWTYGTDGRLLAAPLMEGAVGYDKVRCGLPTLAVAEWNGFVFANFAADPPPFADGLEPIDGTCPPPDAGAWYANRVFAIDFAANWKLVVENASETYHHLGTHQNTLQPLQPAAHNRIVELGGRYVIGYNFSAGQEMGRVADPVCVTRAEIAAAGDPAGSWVTSIFPNLIVAGGADSLLALIVHPTAINETTATAWTLTRTAADLVDGSSWAARQAFVREFSDEDIAMSVGLSRALGSRYARGGPLSPYEATLTPFFDFCRAAVAPG